MPRNNTCPVGCGNTHDRPPARRDVGSHFRCPNGGGTAVWCVRCRRWVPENPYTHGEQVQIIRDDQERWFCYNCACNMFYCERCSGRGFEQGAFQGVPSEQEILFVDDHGYEWLCRACLNLLDRESSVSRVGTQCSSCRTTAQHFDLIKEEYLCSCRVRAIQEVNPTYPIKIIGELV